MKRISRGWMLVAAIGLLPACAGGNVHDPGDDDEASSSAAGGPSGGFGGTGSAACDPVAYQGQALPLDLFLVVDGSGSMAESSTNRWTATAAALKTFAGSATASGIGAGLLVYPRIHELSGGSDPGDLFQNCSACAGDACTLQSGCTCAQVPIAPEDCGSCASGCGCWGSGSCAETSCATDDYLAPDVEIGSLPGAEPAIAQVAEGRQPLGGAAAGLAFSLSAQYATGWALNQPDQNVALVLVANGEPTACTPATSTDIGQDAAKAAASHAAVRTYVVSLGAVPALDAVASAGGSVQAMSLGTNDLATDLAAALEGVRQQARACAYSIPVPSSGSIDPSEVNVRVHGTEENLKQVTGAGACKAAGGGWYYDNPDSPRKIVLCHESCATLKPETGGGADVLVGCPTDVLK